MNRLLSFSEKKCLNEYPTLYACQKNSFCSTTGYVYNIYLISAFAYITTSGTVGLRITGRLVTSNGQTEAQLINIPTASAIYFPIVPCIHCSNDEVVSFLFVDM